MAKTTPSTAPKKSEETQARMTFGEHLEELRKRVLSALYGGLIGVAVCVYFMFPIYRAVIQPYRIVAEHHGALDALSTLKPQESFFTVLTLAVKAGLILTSPWIIFQLWQFVSAGLYKKERRIVYRYVGPSALLFLLGVSFFYFIVLPLTLDFFFSFSSQSGGDAGPAKITWLQEKLLGYSTPKPPPPVVAPQPFFKTQPASVGWWHWIKTHSRTKNLQAQRLPVFSSDPPAPPDGLAILYYNSAEQRVKVRYHDTLLVLPAGPQETSPTSTAQQLPALAEDPPAPPEGVALMYYHTLEQRVKVRLHGQIQIPTVVSQGTVIVNTWRSDDYLNFVAFTALIFGIAFELPMIMLVLAQIEIVRAQSYRDVRKYAYFGIMVAAVIVAPSGDIMTLAFLFIPLVLLYELGILAAAFATRHRPQDD